MKKTLAWSTLVVLSSTSALTLVACKKGNDTDQTVIKIPGITDNRLGDFDNLKKLNISDLFTNFIKQPNIRKDMFAEITKRLQLAVILDNDKFVKQKEQMNVRLDDYMKGQLKIDLGADWEKKIKEEEKTWGGTEGYRQHLLLSEKTPVNVYNIFRSHFIETFQLDYTRITPTDVRSLAQDLVKQKKELGDNFSIESWWLNNTVDTKIKNNILKRAYELTDANDDNLADSIEQKIKAPFTFNDDNLILYDDANINPKMSDSSTIIDKLSQEQKVLAEIWYNDLKPLHVSEFTFAYDGNRKDGLNNGLQTENFSKDTVQKINKLLKYIKNNKTASFETVAQQAGAKDFGERPKLLTLNSSDAEFSPMFKAAAYDLAFSYKVTEKATPTNLEELLQLVSRKPTKGKIVFQKIAINEEKIAVIADNTEIRFIKINGAVELQKEYLKDAIDGEAKNNNNLIPAITDPNNKRLAKTPYLQYLFDNFKNRLDNTSGFNPLNEIKEYTTFDDNIVEKNDNWWSWFWTMMAWVERKPNTVKPNFNWYEKYITFRTENSLLNKDVLEKAITLYGHSKGPDMINRFIEKLTAENNKIAELSNNDENNDVSGLIDYENYSKLFDKTLLWTFNTATSEPAVITTAKLNYTNRSFAENFWKGDSK